MTVRTPVDETFVIELCGGPGGMSEGLRLAGIDPAMTIGIDTSQDACDTAQKAGHPRLRADIAELQPMDVARHYGLPTGLHGSPPCPGFSPAGKGLGRKDTDAILQAIERMGAGEDPDVVCAWLRTACQHPLSALCVEPLRWILKLMPEWFSLEQVSTVLALWEAIAVVLRARGYNVWVGYVHAEQHGVPQTRKRACALGSRVAPVVAPYATHSKFNRNGRCDVGRPWWVSMAEALGWGMTHRPYVTVAAGTSAGGQDPQMLGGSGARQTVRTERQEGRWVEKAMGFPRRWDDGAGGILLVDGEEYRARDLRFSDEPSFTLTEKARSWQVFDVWRTETIVEARDAVRVSVEDAAILQSFSPEYPFQGSRTSQFQQIGDVVPPLMARAMVEGLIA